MGRGDHINGALRRHQLQTASGWLPRAVVRRLHRFFDVFNHAFFSGKLPPAAISLERTPRTRLGHYVTGRNAGGSPR